MASSWGLSWLTSWLDSWGVTGGTPPPSTAEEFICDLNLIILQGGIGLTTFQGGLGLETLQGSMGLEIDCHENG